MSSGQPSSRSSRDTLTCATGRTPRQDCGSASRLRPCPYYTYRIDSSCKSASRGGLLSAPTEGHPESSISSKNQQFELPQLVARAWTPIHTNCSRRPVKVLISPDTLRLADTIPGHIQEEEPRVDRMNRQCLHLEVIPM